MFTEKNKGSSEQSPEELIGSSTFRSPARAGRGIEPIFPPEADPDKSGSSTTSARSSLKGLGSLYVANKKISDISSSTPTVGDINKVKKPKPIVEGINSLPVDVPEIPKILYSPTLTVKEQNAPSKIELTEAEKVLIHGKIQPDAQSVSSQKTTPFFSEIKRERFEIPKKSGKLKKMGLIGLIILFSISLVLGAMVWFDSQTGADLNFISQLLTGKKQVTQKVVPLQEPLAPTEAVEKPPVTAAPVSEVATSTSLKLEIKITPTGYLNVRDLPTTTGKILTKVLPGETYVYTQTKDGWYSILLPDEKSGWVIKDYIEILK